MEIDFTKIANVEVDGIDFNDYPDFVDAFIASAEYDGREMTEEEIDYINDVHLDFVSECVYNHLF